MSEDALAKERKQMVCMLCGICDLFSRIHSDISQHIISGCR